MSERPREALAIASLVALKAAAMLYALHCGFEQISDDDYARVVIAQLFAHHPKLDPSGTSWLPFPFWLYGAAMMLFGRSLAVAHAVAFSLGAVVPLPVYFGLRAMRIPTWGAWLGAFLGALAPWAVWLGLAPVPDGWAGACAAAALLFAAGTRHELTAAALVFIASLSRYEAWPVAVMLGALCVVRAVHRRDRVALVASAMIAILGPVAWIVNNRLTHGDGFHFIARVTAFHESTAPAASFISRLLEYPKAVVTDAPELAIPFAIAVAFVTVRQDMRRVWAVPLAGAACVFAFLVIGRIRGSAPTHHPIRALVSVVVIMGAVVGALVGKEPSSRVQKAAASLGFIAWVAFVAVRVRAVPGATETERREAQLSRGRALVAVPGQLEITPCQYEHYALIAALGTPERVLVASPTHEPVSRACPTVLVR